MLHPKIKEYILRNLRSKNPDLEGDEDDLCREYIRSSLNGVQGRRLTTHSPKFTHPKVDISFPNFIVKSEPVADGYVKTANVPEYIDSYGNALNMPSSALMVLEIEGKQLYRHLRESTEIGKEFAEFLGEEGEDAVKTFMSMAEFPETLRSDGNAKQLYFPDGNDGYFMITPLHSTPVMHQMNSLEKKNRYYNYAPVEGVKKSAFMMESKGEYLEGGYRTIPNLFSIKYGGSKPQNISSYNNYEKEMKVFGTMPPAVRKRKIRIPYRSFFDESVYMKADRYQEIFRKMDRLFKVDKDKLPGLKRFREEKRDACLLEMLDAVAADIASVRYEISQSDYPYRGQLKDDEYTMLYEDEGRYEDTLWQKKIASRFAVWFVQAYRKSVKNPVELGDAEYIYIRKFAEENGEMFIQ